MPGTWQNDECQSYVFVDSDGDSDGDELDAPQGELPVRQQQRGGNGRANHPFKHLHGSQWTDSIDDSSAPSKIDGQSSQNNGASDSFVATTTHMLQPNLDYYDITSTRATAPTMTDIYTLNNTSQSNPPSSTTTTTPNRSDNVQRKALRRLQQAPRPRSYTSPTIDRTLTHPLTGANLTMGFNTSLPKSRLDMYIMTTRQLLRSSHETHLLTSDIQRTLTAESVLWTVREAWPSAEGYWNMTATFRGFLCAELWRNFPCERTYRALPAAYRPTKAQLCVPHSPMIDWLPWPDVRDLAIEYQDVVDVDEVFRLAIHNVVAHRKRRRKSMPLLPSPGPFEDEQTETDKTSFRVWDLICLEKANGTDPLADPSLEKRAVLRSPGVKAVLQAYDLEYDDFDTQKLDDEFFEVFPWLYAKTAASSWRLGRLDGVARRDAGGPKVLTREAVIRLKEKLEGVVGGEIVL